MTNKYENRPCHVAMFVSRNKDNKYVEGFNQRTKAFLTQKTIEELSDSFVDFYKKGKPEELSRFYLSVNPRNSKAIQKRLQHYLIDNPDTNLADIESLIASLAMKSGTAITKKFLFDYDADPISIGVFLDDVRQALGDGSPIKVQKTVSGYAIVTEHGFDTRDLLAKWKDVSLKRDAMLFVDAKRCPV